MTVSKSLWVNKDDCAVLIGKVVDVCCWKTTKCNHRQSCYFPVACNQTRLIYSYRAVSRDIYLDNVLALLNYALYSWIDSRVVGYNNNSIVLRYTYMPL